MLTIQLLALSLILVLQEAVTPLGKVIALVAAPWLGWISEKAYGGLKTIFPAYDKLDPKYHQSLAPLFGLLGGFLASWLNMPGLSDLTDLHGITANVVDAIVNGLFMAGIFRWEKSKNPGDTTVKLETSRASKVE